MSPGAQPFLLGHLNQALLVCLDFVLFVMVTGNQAFICLPTDQVTSVLWGVEGGEGRRCSEEHW